VVLGSVTVLGSPTITFTFEAISRRDMGAAVVLAHAHLLALAEPAVPRHVRVDGVRFVESATSSPIVLSGPNVVVKGWPWFPEVKGSSVCADNPMEPGAECQAYPKLCTSCKTFNQADIDHMKALGENSIRLGVVWAGAQPRDENALDPDFLRRMHAVLNLTDANGIHVVLDNHGDMVGSQNCGNGVPTWFQRKAAADLFGKPLRTSKGLASLVGKLIPASHVLVEETEGYDRCGDNESLWAAHAGDPNYNLLNECCIAINSANGRKGGDNPIALGYTETSQRTMDRLLLKGAGRDEFVRFWALIATAVKGHPSAFAVEPMNEPMSVRRRVMFDTWRAVAEAVHEKVPDMSIALADSGTAPLYNPSGINKWIPKDEWDMSKETFEWIHNSNTLFYAWHYGDAAHVVNDMLSLGRQWDVPVFSTEASCAVMDVAAAVNVSASYWHYSSYCNTGPYFGNRSLNHSFGACILGWAGGNSSKCGKQNRRSTPLAIPSQGVVVERQPLHWWNPKWSVHADAASGVS